MRFDPVSDAPYTGADASLAMSPQSRIAWDAESLQKIRLVGDRRYRRTWGSVCLGTLALMASVGVWGIDFHMRPVLFMVAYWTGVLVVFCCTILVAVLDVWSLRLEFALKRRTLADEFLQKTRADIAPRNGHPRASEPPRL